MPADYVRRTYGVTYKRGDRVTVDDRPGVIVSFPGQYLGVRFDGERHTSRAHPTWRVCRIPVPLPRPASCGARICTADELGPHRHEGGYLVLEPGGSES